MLHVSSRSSVATLRTAIHLLLTYLLTYSHYLACPADTSRPAGHVLLLFLISPPGCASPNLHDGRTMAVDEWSEISFCGSLKDVTLATNFPVEIDLQSTNLTWVRVPSARFRRATTYLLIEVFSINRSVSATAARWWGVGKQITRFDGRRRTN